MKTFRTKSNNNAYKTKRGFTLLIAVLATSIILSISLGVFDIITKEIKLVGLGRESQISFFAADAGVECAFYWEIKHPNMTYSAFKSSSTGQTVTCGGKSSVVGKETNVSNFTVPIGSAYCAEVQVDRSSVNQAVIISRGYNIPYDSSTGKCSTASTRKVERAIRLILKKS